MLLEIVTHTGGKDEGLCWVHSNCANIIGMRLERCDLLRGVVVVDAQLEVIGTWTAMSASLPEDSGVWALTCYYPILPRDEATGAYGYIGELEGLDDGLRYVRPDVDVACFRQRSAYIGGFQLCIPLYKVVRIHGSVG